MNGLQYPNAIHMAVTRPQTQSGVVEAWATDLDAAVEYARTNRDAPPQSGAIFGSVPGGWTAEADGFIRAVMSDMMGQHQSCPRHRYPRRISAHLQTSTTPARLLRLRRSQPCEPGPRMNDSSKIVWTHPRVHERGPLTGVSAGHPCRSGAVSKPW